MKTRILIVDDHGVLRTGLAALLRAETNLEVVGEAGDGKEALRLAGSLRPEIILMDISLPDSDGIQLTRRIVKLYPGMKVLILTVHEDKGLLYEAIRAGAAGYVLKRTVKSELINAIHSVLDGETYVQSSIARYLQTAPPRKLASNRPGPELLTTRELDVLKLIAQGYTNNQVASQLSISVRTVEYHRSNVMDKLYLQSRVDLVRYASEHGLLDNTRSQTVI